MIETPLKVAAIDIGTVTTRLLIAEISSEGPREIVRRTDITHLGEGLGATGRLSAVAMGRVEAVIARYAAELARHGVGAVRTVATSASRDASNAGEFVELLAVHGVMPEVVSGQTEARLAFAGATWGRTGEGFLVNDIGGGSTEVVFGAVTEEGSHRRMRIDLARSVDVGSRRVTELFLRSDPPVPTELDGACEWIREQLTPVIARLPVAARVSVALAGTATTLSAIDQRLEVYDPQKVHDSVLSLETIRKITGRLSALPLERRKREVTGLDPGRASVIVAGGLVLGELLDLAGLDSTLVSEQDILVGIVLDLSAAASEMPGAE